MKMIKMKITLCLQFLLIIHVFSVIASTDWTITFCDDKSENDVYFDLSNIGIIKTLKRSFISGKSIKCLNLGYNSISSIDQNAFQNLSELIALNLSGNFLDFEKFLQLHEFPKLKTLVLDDAFSKDKFYGNAYGDLIEPVKQQRLSIFPQLEKLSMSNYRTSELSNWLGKFDFPKLTHLRLTNGFLTGDINLPSYIIENINHLYLDDSEMNFFNGQRLPTMRYLSITNSRVKKLCAISCNEYSMIPSDMQNLEYLSLIGNSIEDIDGDAFFYSVRMIHLDLTNNSIKAFPRHTFDNMTNLETLKLDINQLDQIPNICGLKELREFSINENLIRSINAESFCNLSKLAIVSLRKNGLFRVAVDTFGYLSSLKRLDLSWNEIESLPEYWIRSNINLEELNLGTNKFNNITRMSLGKLESLGRLHIGQNPLKIITIESLVDIPISTTLYLSPASEIEPQSNQLIH